MHRRTDWPEIVTVLLLALTPGLGNFAGGLAAEALPSSHV